MAKMFIAGESVDSITGATYEVLNPANGDVVDTLPKGNADDAKRAIDAAEAAFDEWSHTSAEERAKLLFKAAEIVDAERKSLAELLCREQGKPFQEASGELEHFHHGIDFYAGLASKVRGAHVPLPAKNAYGMVVLKPLGVCGAIVPWNFPITLMGTKVGPALAAGNTVVVKPASTTPLTTIRIIELMNQAGLPKGVLNVVTGPGGIVGEELLSNPKVRRIAFTGESATGKHVASVACGDFKRVTLELGGSDPMIVCEDADIAKAVTGAMVGRFWNAGQACLAVKRLYLFDKIYDAFLKSLVDKVSRYEVGDGMTRAEKPKIRMGPLHTAAQREEIEAQVKDAVDRGAKVLIGGARPEGAQYERGFFYQPTILENVPDDARAVKEETFGPLLPVFRVSSLDEALERANGSIYGLGSSIWTKNLDNIESAIDRLQAGNVWVNSLHYGYDELPFGGVKASGFGREHGPEALDYYLEPKGVVITR
ncbi:MAG TPA: aldehyde dehydrogenase family protein [Blastocatellia bacterium]|jgi:succinate-semialdehyde dehydrogenase/glutarate-semialdehyde dehydrogenase|nr:aldehyde dehydrogenase family protein [Blastocatellia bacterium]